MSADRRMNFTCVALLASLLVSGCGKSGGDSHAKAANDIVAELQNVSDALAGVTDKASAQTAGQKISAAAGAIEKICDRIKKLPQATDKENESIQADVKPKMQAINAQVQTNVARIRNDRDIADTLQGPLMQLQMAMMGIGVAVNGGGKNMPSNPPPPPGMSSPPSGPLGPQSKEEIEKRMTEARSKAEEFKKKFTSKYSPDKIVTVEITGIPANADKAKLLAHLRNLAGVKDSLGRGGATSQMLMLAPVDDVAALSSKIDFGKATLDAANRTIKVEADAAKVSNPPADW